jgi:hypothetical protein
LKLNAYGLSKSSLDLLCSYLTKRAEQLIQWSRGKGKAARNGLKIFSK